MYLHMYALHGNRFYYVRNKQYGLKTDKTRKETYREMNREEIMQKALELGQMIAQDREVMRVQQLDRAYAENEELQTLMTEYNAQTQVLNVEYAKEERDEEMIAIVQKRVNELYDALASHELITQYRTAQQDVDAFMKAVNEQIQFGITGKRPSACTHDCSTCGGCH